MSSGSASRPLIVGATVVGARVVVVEVVVVLGVVVVVVVVVDSVVVVPSVVVDGSALLRLHAASTIASATNRKSVFLREIMMRASVSEDATKSTTASQSRPY